MSPVLTLFINIILHTVPEERIKQLNELLLDIRTEFGKSMREAMKERDDYKTKYPKESKESKGQYNFICYSKFYANRISRALITKHSFCTCI